MLPDILKGILSRRGITTEEELTAFLNPVLGGLARPDVLPGITEAADVIMDAVRTRSPIVVFGDYDCDGICATAILVRVFRALNVPASPFLPERVEEGYGMSEKAVSRMLAEHPDVKMVVTVDNGVSSRDRVAELIAKGIRVVVTDHHLPGDTLPDCPLVNPKVASAPGLENLCGAAVAFMLANALVDRAKAEGLFSGGKIAGGLLVMAGLATVTDIMPLTGQNRILVAESMRRFRQLAPVGLLELYDHAARAASSGVTSKDFAFLLGPRINAAGRMSDGTEALELVLTDDRERARQLAIAVDERNVERKMAEQKMVDEALAQLVPGAPVQVIDLPDGHPGVSGIVAARMLDRIADKPVPVCVVVRGRGSARAPDGYNVRDAFAAVADTLENFGGHAAAGGFTVREGRLEDFRKAFGEACAAQRAGLAASGIVVGEAQVDAVVTAEDITLELAEALTLLEPFGEGNPEPVFEIRSVNLMEIRPVGSDGRHMGLSLRTRQRRMLAVWWGAGDRVDEFRAASGIPFDVRFHLAVSEYQTPHPELRVVDIRAVQ